MAFACQAVDTYTWEDVIKELARNGVYSNFLVIYIYLFKMDKQELAKIKDVMWPGVMINYQ